MDKGSRIRVGLNVHASHMREACTPTFHAKLERRDGGTEGRNGGSSPSAKMAPNLHEKWRGTQGICTGRQRGQSMVTLGVFRPLLRPVLLPPEIPGQSTGLIARLNAREVLLAAHPWMASELACVPRTLSASEQQRASAKREKTVTKTKGKLVHGCLTDSNSHSYRV